MFCSFLKKSGSKGLQVLREKKPSYWIQISFVKPGRGSQPGGIGDKFSGQEVWSPQPRYLSPQNVDPMLQKNNTVTYLGPAHPEPNLLNKHTRAQHSASRVFFLRCATESVEKSCERQDFYFSNTQGWWSKKVVSFKMSNKTRLILFPWQWKTSSQSLFWTITDTMTVLFGIKLTKIIIWSFP